MKSQTSKKKASARNSLFIDLVDENMDTKEVHSIIVEIHDVRDTDNSDWFVSGSASADIYIDSIEGQYELRNLGSEDSYNNSQNAIYIYQVFTHKNHQLAADNTGVSDFDDALYELVKNDLEIIKSSLDEDIILSGKDAVYFLNLLNNPDHERVDVRIKTIERASKIRERYSRDDKR